MLLLYDNIDPAKTAFMLQKWYSNNTLFLSMGLLSLVGVVVAVEEGVACRDLSAGVGTEPAILRGRGFLGVVLLRIVT